MNIGELELLNQWVNTFKEAMQRGHSTLEIDTCFNVIGFPEQWKEYIVKRLIPQKIVPRSKELKVLL